MEKMNDIDFMKSLGFVILNARNDIKAPIVSSWQTKKVSEKYRGRNVAVLTGKNSNITVVDIDNKGKISQWYDLLKKHDPFNTLTVNTRHNGLHYYFKYDSNIRNTTGVIPDLIDVRNDGGCVIAPPSIYEVDENEMKDGVTYKEHIEVEIDDELGMYFQYEFIDKNAPIIEMPTWIKDMLPKNNEYIQNAIKDYSISPNDSSNDISDISSEISYSKLEINNKYERIKTMLNMLKSKRYNDYNNWTEIGMIIYNELGEQGFDLFDEFSQKSYKYKNSNDLRYHWKTFTDDDTLLKHGKIKMGSLVDWAKEDSPKEFKREERERKKREEKEAEDANYEEFLRMIEEFEKTHCKIVSEGVYVRHNNNKVDIITQKKLIEMYCHMRYPNDPDKSFITEWIKYEYIRKYDIMDVYPDKANCPDNCFNLWTDFAFDTIEEYTDMPVERDLFLNHINILCNHEQEVYEHVIKWIAIMVQYPEVKLNMLTFLSKQGAGKGLLLKMLENIIGTNKYFTTSSPDRDVYGSFNSQISSCLLVNMDEMEKKQAIDSDGKIKNLITEQTIIINTKGVKAYKIKSYHKFIVTTNNLETIKISKDDRRNVLIESSNELIGNKNYFVKLWSTIDNPNFIKTMGLYFRSVQVNPSEFKFERPMTQLKQELIDLSKNKYEMWLEHFAMGKIGTIKYPTSTCYDDFKRFAENNHMAINEVNIIKFGKYVSRLPHVTKKKEKMYNSHIFDFDAIRKDLGYEDEAQPDLDDIAEELETL